MPTLLDSTALIDILEDNPGANTLLEHLKGEAVFTTRINVFEVLVGVYALRQHVEKKLRDAEQLFLRLNILELNEVSAKWAARIQGSLYQQGKPIDDTDCLTAAIALSHGITKIATRNKKHFEQIKQISVETY
ncbi:MAG: type II toxin-antitoxin system VapC family toxin [Candidatus Aenigmarchaeota archaeon]|nr:type II toxin-antitoxin system VapC family toxin [Candidatus Aenigmarchaeota archaeon]